MAAIGLNPVAAYGKDGKSAAALRIGELGGKVGVTGKGEGKAAMGINVYGNGAVSTYDKNGYLQEDDYAR